MKPEPCLLQIMTKAAKAYADLPAPVRATIRHIRRRLKAGPTWLPEPRDDIGENNSIMGLALQTMLRLGLAEVGEKGESGWLCHLPTPYHQILSEAAIARIRSVFYEKGERSSWPKVVEYLASGPKSFRSIGSRVHGLLGTDSWDVSLLVFANVVSWRASPPFEMLDTSWADCFIWHLKPAALNPQYHPAIEHPNMASGTTSDAEAAVFLARAAPEIEEGEDFPEDEKEPIDADEPEPPPEEEEFEPGPPIDDGDDDLDFD